MKQWYENNRVLLDAEIELMACIMPDAKYGFLSDGRLYWNITIRPVICGKRKNWTFLAVYDSDHPRHSFGGSVKFYPVKPNYIEMVHLVNSSNVVPKTIPHLLRDDLNQIYICTNAYSSLVIPTSKSRTRNFQQLCEKVSAATSLRYAMRWVTVFELGLIDQKTWSLFHEHGKI